ncbi:helix-turn-helix domain-containing protein [Amycolatopsis cihanbeyliensis]|uniref:Helix-turn-helix protein n=1 Tax=Amycolatopsis cihanbeyliensis TaxID=1128664 RepID=A0A542DJM4_AMYCI|nr:helix-turn-helix transcriptional regulator [Amycolatopsis cihanbeyliensis]TQJ03299.1 helix-turn-helix protein [Amycolatopsis cihanbeyliensis]
MPKQKPKPQARGLAEGLRAARKECKLAMIEVVEKLDWSQSTLSRIETGLRNASVEEVSALLAVYQVTGARRDGLLEMARDVDRPNWLETRYADVPHQAKTLAQYESDATRIVDAASILVPGLLQTPSYVRSLMHSGGVAPADIQARVDLRAERQKVLDRRKPPSLVAFVDEAALRRRIGGSRVMADQLRHLVTMAERATVELRVIPFDVGGHSGVNGAYVLLEFYDARPVVHLEHRRSGLFLHQKADVDPYVEATASLNAVALDPMQSVRMVESIAESYD